MSYVIDAWLEGDEFRLKIMDADTRVVRMQWAYPSGSGHAVSCPCGAEASLHELFKSLFLLACPDRFSLSEASRLTGFGDECLRCDGCSGAGELRTVERLGSYPVR